MMSHKQIYAIGFFVTLVVCSPNLSAQDAQPKLPSFSWHLANVWWEFESTTPHFESLSIDVTIDRDIPDDCNFYIAPIGVGKLNDIMFYGGLQTNINGYLDRSDRTRRHPGKGVIFSRWGKKTLSYDFARKAANGLVESAGYEGDFVSVRRPIKWTKGTYTYRLVKADYQKANDREYTWINVMLNDHQTGRLHYGGSLRFEGRDLTFWNRHSAFVEVYSTSKIPRGKIPEVTVTFGYPRINGQAPKLKSASAYYPNTGVAAGPDCAKITTKGAQVIVTVGKIFTRSKNERRHALNLKTPC